jgi:hypothetical protein
VQYRPPPSTRLALKQVVSIEETPQASGYAEPIWALLGQVVT